jgi:ubiquinone/menaquinone biosynthesis C-methylase UbiE
MDMANGDFYGAVFEDAQIPRDAVVLDIGCGDGTDMVKLNELGHRGRKIGLETPARQPGETESKIAFIIDNLLDHDVDNAEVLIGDVRKIPLKDDSVDVVVAASMLQELKEDEVDGALDEINRVLVHGGLLIIIENREGNKPLHHGYLDMMANYLQGQAPRPFSARFTHEKALKKMLARRDFHVPHEKLQNKGGKNNLIIREPGQVETLLLSLATYRDRFEPKIDPAWDEDQIEEEKQAFEMRLKYDWAEVRQLVRADVLKKIRAGGAREKIKRGALYCVAVKTEERPIKEVTRILSDTLGRLAARNLREIKERP